MSGEHPHADLEQRIAALETTQVGVAETLISHGARLTDAEAHTHSDPPELVRGSWVLQQVDSMAQFSNLQGQIEAAVAQPAALGLSIRTGWDRIEPSPGVYDFALFDAARMIADGAGKPLSVRFMGGRWTPEHVGGPTHTESSETVPTPFLADGSVNQTWLDAYTGMVDAVTTWAVTNDVTLVHYAWWGALWAELHHGTGVRNAPGYGASWQAAWLPAHEALMQVVLDRTQGEPIFAEFPLTGRGPLTSGQSEALADYLSPHSQTVVQMNGWDPTRIAGAPNTTTENQWKTLADTIRNRDQVLALQDIGVQQWVTGRAASAYLLADRYEAAYTELYLPRWTDPEMVAAAAAWV